MESKVIDLLNQININNNIVLPIAYLNVIYFDLPLEQTDVESDNMEGTHKISSITYNQNKEMFEQFKEALVFHHPNLSETDSLSENVFVCISILKDFKKCFIEIHFN